MDSGVCFQKTKMNTKVTKFNIKLRLISRTCLVQEFCLIFNIVQKGGGGQRFFEQCKKMQNWQNGTSLKNKVMASQILSTMSSNICQMGGGRLR